MGSGMVVGGVVVGGGVVFWGSWQIRLRGRHLAGGFLLQLEKDNRGPWQMTCFWGVLEKKKLPRAKGSPHPSCLHTTEASWGFLQRSWLHSQLELHTVYLRSACWTDS